MISVEPVADPNELQRLYGERFAGRSDYRNRVWQVLCAQMFNRWVKPSDTVLDLGSGYCEFINNIDASRKLALDLNPESVKRANPDVEIVLHDCSTPWPIEPGSLDVVFTSNFLEHLLDKPTVSRTLAEAHRALKPGGLIVCMGPNVRYVPGIYWDYFDHYVALTERSLREALEQPGFAIEYSVGRFLPFSMSEGKEKPVALVSWYLKMKPVWKILGKQFLVVGRKSAPARGDQPLP